MIDRRIARGMAAATLPLALAVQSVLAIGGTPPIDATPEAPERRTSIDPGFAVVAGGDVDPGFGVAWEDTSNDAGFLVIPGTPAPSPTPATATPPARVVTLGAP